ncbi:tannase and feruloyl esterase [Seiridium cupressi]
MIYPAAPLLALGLGVTHVLGDPICSALTFKGVLPDNATVGQVEKVQSGGTYGDGIPDLNYPIQPTGLPELCAVTILVNTSSTSFYRFGLFLPTEWNSRFLAVGNGGFGGGINWLDMGGGVGYGFAVVSTDTGHNSVSTDVSWALDSPEKKTDWGWRSIHGTVTLGKQLVEAYYEKKIAYSYYNGCSTGGRQGLKEVQISPESFDGAIVGSSAWYSSHLNPWVTKVGSYNLPFNASNHIDVGMFPAMANETISQCDGLDGVEDGIISAPNQCMPDYTTLSCNNTGANSSACLTDAQIQTAKKVYADYLSDSGELLYPGLTPGCEQQWSIVLSQPDTSPYGINFIRDFLYDDASWEWTSYNDSVITDAVRLNPGNATADQYDLSQFKSLGGKMIIYHGLADGLVPPKGSELYYNQVAETMAGGDVSGLQDFFRYFEVAGMGHCWSTSVDAPWAFGGGSQASVLGTDVWSVPGFKDAQHDILLAMMQWVENGTAVDSVVATTWDSPTNVSTPVLRQRPLCPYPQVALYDGVGDVDSAPSWTYEEQAENGKIKDYSDAYSKMQGLASVRQ